MAKPRSMSRQKIGSRKKSTQASQYRVGRYGLTAGRVEGDQHLAGDQYGQRAKGGTEAESVKVDRNSAIAATPSIDKAMNPTVPSTRMVRWPG